MLVPETTNNEGFYFLFNHRQVSHPIHFEHPCHSLPLVLLSPSVSQPSFSSSFLLSFPSNQQEHLVVNRKILLLLENCQVRWTELGRRLWLQLFFSSFFFLFFLQHNHRHLLFFSLLPHVLSKPVEGPGIFVSFLTQLLLLVFVSLPLLFSFVPEKKKEENVSMACVSSLPFLKISFLHFLSPYLVFESSPLLSLSPQQSPLSNSSSSIPC